MKVNSLVTEDFNYSFQLLILKVSHEISLKIAIFFYHTHFPKLI